jgi:hypothetical protein
MLKKNVGTYALFGNVCKWYCEKDDLVTWEYSHHFLCTIA